MWGNLAASLPPVVVEGNGVPFSSAVYAENKPSKATYSSTGCFILLLTQQPCLLVRVSLLSPLPDPPPDPCPLTAPPLSLPLGMKEHSVQGHGMDHLLLAPITELGLRLLG